MRRHFTLLQEGMVARRLAVLLERLVRLVELCPRARRQVGQRDSFIRCEDVTDSSIVDPRVVDRQVSQCGQARESGQPGVGELRVAQADAPQRRRLRDDGRLPRGGGP